MKTEITIDLYGIKSESNALLAWYEHDLYLKRKRCPDKEKYLFDEEDWFPRFHPIVMMQCLNEEMISDSYVYIVLMIGDWGKSLQILKTVGIR